MSENQNQYHCVSLYLSLHYNRNYLYNLNIITSTKTFSDEVTFPVFNDEDVRNYCWESCFNLAYPVSLEDTKAQMETVVPANTGFKLPNDLSKESSHTRLLNSITVS